MSVSLNDRPNKVTVSGDAVTVTTGSGIQGPTGPAGIAVQSVAPLDTSILWADTSAVGDAVVPAGGTTGQVLAKQSNADYDTIWTADKGIPESLIDAAGDLIVGSAADTAARLAVGTANGQILTVDSSAATGLKWSPMETSTFRRFGYIRSSLSNGSDSATIGLNTTFNAHVAPRLGTTINQVALEVTTARAGQTARMGIYVCTNDDDIPANGLTLIDDLGTVDCSTTGIKTISSSVVINFSLFLVAVAPSEAFIAFRANNTSSAASNVIMGWSNLTQGRTLSGWRKATNHSAALPSTVTPDAVSGGTFAVANTFARTAP